MSKLFKLMNKIFSLVFKGEITLALYEISLRMPNWLFRFNKAYMMYTENLNIPELKNPDIHVRTATLSDIVDIVRISGVDIEKVRYLLEAGVNCFIASESNKQPSSIVWSASGMCYIKGLALEYDFKDNEAYSFWSVTLPEARGRGLHYATVSERYRCELINGRFRTYAIIEAINKLSYDMRVRTGFIQSHLIYYITMFCLKISYVKSLKDNTRKIKCFVKEPVDCVTI